MMIYKTNFPGKAANYDRKIALMRAATTAAETRYSSGGGVKVRGPRAKAVTLADLESVRKLARSTFRDLRKDRSK